MNRRDSRAIVRVGDTVTRCPITLGDTTDRKSGPMKGVVVYVHPKGRFHVVSFGKGAREGFPGICTDAEAREWKETRK